MTKFYRHKATGRLYYVVCEAVAEWDRKLDLVVYRGIDGDVWVRPSIEFYDGRFVPAEE